MNNVSNPCPKCNGYGTRLVPCHTHPNGEVERLCGRCGGSGQRFPNEGKKE